MKTIDLSTIKWNEQDLLPAVVQDSITKQVLMVAYMNKESLQKTLDTGQTWFWSRSRQELWHKGATSGYIQNVQRIELDCDRDTLLMFVEQTGVACHTGSYSCFGEKEENNLGDYQILADLTYLLAQRDEERPEGSYTTYLFENGVDKILKKVGEEASEVIIAAKNDNNDELVPEIGDLLYHVMVLLQAKGIPFADVLAELKARHQDSSNDQKYKRKFIKEQTGK